MFNKTGKIFLSIMVIIMMFFSVNTISASEVIDLDAKGSISVTPRADGKAIGQGMSFTLYQVGYGSATKNGELSWKLSDSFKDSNVSLNDLDDIASKLSNYVSKTGISGTIKTVNNTGTVIFDDLSVGVYLLMQTNDGGTGYIVDPFVVSVPFNEDGKLIYDVDSSPKMETMKLVDVSVKKIWNDGGDIDARPDKITVTLYRDNTVIDTISLSDDNDWKHTWNGLVASEGYTVKETTVKDYQASYDKDGYSFTITNSKELVYTGQLNWPIPVLAISGIILFGIGWAIVFIKRDM